MGILMPFEIIGPLSITQGPEMKGRVIEHITEPLTFQKVFPSVSIIRTGPPSAVCKSITIAALMGVGTASVSCAD